MTLQEYNKMMEEFREIEKKREEFLSNKLKECFAKDPDDEARIMACDIFYYAIYLSVSGQSDSHVDTKELADRVHNILVNELWEYMLDDPEVFEEDDEWVISANFGGNYCLNWEG